MFFSGLRDKLTAVHSFQRLELSNENRLATTTQKLEEITIELCRLKENQTNPEDLKN